MKPVHIIGVPLDLGGGRRGVDMGPSAMRIAGLGEQIASLGRGSFLVSAARGEVLDQTAALNALSTNHLGGLAMDVFDPEPPDGNDHLLGLDSVVLAPHSVAMTNELIAACGALDIQAVLDVMHGREPQGIVLSRVVQHTDWRRRLEANRIRFGGDGQKTN